MSTALAAALSVLALLAAPLCTASPTRHVDEEIYAAEMAEILAAMQRGAPPSVIEADPATRQALFYEWLNSLQAGGEALPVPQALQQAQQTAPLAHTGALPPGRMAAALIARPNFLTGDSEALDDKDKRGNYMSLCHFKICNMGRKRNLRTPSIPAWGRQ